MTPTEAAKLLEVSPDATPEQLEARFLDLRRKLEDKVAKAPTPGLQAKYRETLAHITTAFETLTLAADSSSLPVLQKPSAVSGQTSAAAPASSRTAAAAPAASAPVAKKKSGNGKEFVFVALLAVALLGGGSWYVMKTRAEKAEQARIAAEAAAQAAAENLRVKQAEETRIAVDAKAAAQLRTQLATAKVTWEGLENRLREAERQTSEAKSELRSFRDGPAWKKAELSAMAQRHEMFSNWLNEYLVNHPFKVARATAEQLLSDKLTTEAAAAVAEMKQYIDKMQQYVRGRAEQMLESTVKVKIESKPAGVKFVFTDAYGRSIEGVTPATLIGQPLSHLHHPKWDGGIGGDTEVVVGEFTVTPSARFHRVGWEDIVQNKRTSLEGASFSAEFPASQEVNIAVAEAQAKIIVDQKFVGLGQAKLLDLVPGEHALQIEAEGYPPYRTKFKVAVSTDKLPVFRYSFKELAIENVDCSPCGASGAINRSNTCFECNGRGWVQCLHCAGEGYVWVDASIFAGGGSKQRCTVCNASRRAKCGWEYSAESRCSNGVKHSRETCQTCGGDGHVSRLQLSK